MTDSTKSISIIKQLYVEIKQMQEIEQQRLNGFERWMQLSSPDALPLSFEEIHTVNAKIRNRLSLIADALVALHYLENDGYPNAYVLAVPSDVMLEMRGAIDLLQDVLGECQELPYAVLTVSDPEEV